MTKPPTQKELQALAGRALGGVRRLVEWGYGRRVQLRAIHLIGEDCREVRIVAGGKAEARRALAAALRALAGEE